MDSLRPNHAGVRKYRDGYFVSISNSDRAPGLNYLATVYNGMDLAAYPFQDSPGEELIFLGRIHPDKGVHLAIAVARMSGLPLRIAGIIQDKEYFAKQVEPYLDDREIRYIGPVDVAGKNDLFARAKALLHLNTIPERFGLVLAEANAAGVPVIATDLGSCREVIEDGQTGISCQWRQRGRGGFEAHSQNRSRGLSRARSTMFFYRNDGGRLRARLLHHFRA